MSVLHALGVTPPTISSIMATGQGQNQGGVNQNNQGNNQSVNQINANNSNGYPPNGSYPVVGSNHNNTSYAPEMSRNVQFNNMTNNHNQFDNQVSQMGQNTVLSGVDDDISQLAKRNRPNPILEREEDREEKFHQDMGSLSTSHYHFPTGRRCSPRPIDALRFERMGPHEWGIVETKVYDVCEFMKMLALDMGDSSVCLIDETILQKSIGFLPKKHAVKMSLGGIGYKSSAEGVTSLEKELTLNDSLVTSWTKSDRPQLREMACQWQWQKQLPSLQREGESVGKDETLITFWRSSDTTDFTSSGRNSCACDNCQDTDVPCHGGGNHIGPGHNSCSCNDCSHGLTHHNHEANMVENSLINESYSLPTTVPSQTTPFNQTLPLHSDNIIIQRPRQSHVHMHNHNTHNKPKGYLVYEQSLQVGVVVRANVALGLKEDLWYAYICI